MPSWFTKLKSDVGVLDWLPFLTYTESTDPFSSAREQNNQDRSMSSWVIGQHRCSHQISRMPHMLLEDFLFSVCFIFIDKVIPGDRTSPVESSLGQKLANREE